MNNTKGDGHSSFSLISGRLEKEKEHGKVRYREHYPMRKLRKIRPDAHVGRKLAILAGKTIISLIYLDWETREWYV